MRHDPFLRRKLSRVLFVAAVACVVTSGAPRSTPAATLTAIGYLPPSHYEPKYEKYWPPSTIDDISEIIGVSADGSTVIGRLASGPFVGAFHWTLATGYTAIGDLWDSVAGGSYSTVNAVSADGTVVVGVSNVDDVTGSPNNSPAFKPPRRIAVRWSMANGLEPLAELPGGQLSSEAFGVSQNGDVIVGRAGNSAVRWTADGIDLFAHGEGMYATGVSADGSVVIGKMDTGDAFVWEAAGGMTPIGGKVGGEDFSAFALGVSADGTTVVGAMGTDQGGQAFRWTREAGVVELGFLPGGGNHSAAAAATADGSIVVGWSDTAELVTQAAIWSEGKGVRSILALLNDHRVKTLGWQFEEAIGISDNGQVIVGNGRYLGTSVGWMIDLAADADDNTVPEPGAAVLGLVGLLAVSGLVMGRGKRVARRNSVA